MKTKKNFCIIILIFFLAPAVLAEDQEKEISVENAMKAFCGTWFADGYAPRKKKIWNLNGTFEMYTKKTDTIPHAKGTFKIEKAWLDDEGNICFTAWVSFVMGDSWILNKISNAGTVLEYCRYSSPENAPTEIDDDRCIYSFRFIKKKN